MLPISKNTNKIDDENLANECQRIKELTFYDIKFRSGEIPKLLMIKISLMNLNKKNHKFFHVYFQSAEIRTKLIMKILLRNANN